MCKHAQGEQWQIVQGVESRAEDQSGNTGQGIDSRVPDKRKLAVRDGAGLICKKKWPPLG